MKHRQLRHAENLGSGRTFRIIAVTYLAVSSLVLLMILAIFIGIFRLTEDDTGQSAVRMPAWAIPATWVTQLVGVVVVSALLRQCAGCRQGPAKRITTAMEKMGKGDLGWKITLRRGDELAEIADSVTRASESLAERIGRLQTQTRQLTEVENYLIDSIEADRVGNPNTLKTLRRLKICTHRLCSDMEDFQVSAAPNISQGMPAGVDEPVDQLQKA